MVLPLPSLLSLLSRSFALQFHNPAEPVTASTELVTVGHIDVLAGQRAVQHIRVASNGFVFSR